MRRSTKPVLIAVVTIACLVAVPRSNAVNPSRLAAGVKAVLALVSTYSAAKMAEELGTSVQDYWADTAKPGESIYSARIELTDTSWADWFSDPDVYMTVECEGQPTVLLPEVRHNWDGSPVVFTFRCSTLPEGSYCAFRLHDDDETSNAAWNGIMSSRVHWKVGTSTGSLPAAGTVPLPIEASANGSVQVLDPTSSKNYVLDAPDTVAVGMFEIPAGIAPADKWELTGSLIKDSQAVGSASFTHWYTNEVPVESAYVIRPKVLFWTVLTAGTVAVLVYVCWGRQGEAGEAPPTNG